MKKYIIILICNLFLLVAFAQSIDWSTVKIEGFGMIGLPSSMEIQKGLYKEIVGNQKIINGISASNVIFQQRNLNEFDKNSFDTYARVFIKTIKGYNGKFKKINNSILQAEADEINNSLKNELLNSNINVLEWSDAKITKLNNQNTIVCKYKRKIGNHPPTAVEFYFFQNNDRMHIVHLEFSIDKNNWSNTFEKIKSTIKIYEM
ncbi:MAG: hypothetical protein RL708_1026 [Bacteroidota bacterium]|jgi:hypothetical protein